jgi:hypothetical protein
MNFRFIRTGSRKEVSQMYKRVILACAALAAFAAFAVIPAVASASEPVLTYPTGTIMPINTKIRAHNVNGNTKMTLPGGGAVECSNSTMTGTLIQNNGVVKGNVESASFKGTESEERCTSPLGATKVTVTSLPWCLSSTEVTNGFEVRGGLCSEATRALTFTLDVAGLSCSYSRANVNGTFTTHPEDAILTISEIEFAKSGGSFLCPASGKLDMSFTLEHDPTLKEEEEGKVTNPIYID